jgi:hypothetical protein
MSSCQLAPRTDLAEPLCRRQPLPQVIIGNAGLEIAACVHPECFSSPCFSTRRPSALLPFRKILASRLYPRPGGLPNHSVPSRRRCLRLRLLVHPPVAEPQPRQSGRCSIAVGARGWPMRCRDPRCQISAQDVLPTRGGGSQYFQAKFDRTRSRDRRHTCVQFLSAARANNQRSARAPHRRARPESETLRRTCRGPFRVKISCGNMITQL